MVMKGRTATENLTVMNDAIITEENIQKAMVVADNGGYAILLTLTPAGQHQLNADAKDMLNKRLAIIINETLVSAPLLRSTVFGHPGPDSGIFHRGQATKIAQDLSH